MYLAHDLLDQPLVDRAGHHLGRVDGLVLTWRDGEAPRVAFIEIGATTLSHRLPRALGAVVRAFARRFGARGGAPYRIPWERVSRVGHREVEVDVDAARSPALATERWLRDHVIAHIPGSA